MTRAAPQLAPTAAPQDDAGAQYAVYARVFDAITRRIAAEPESDLLLRMARRLPALRGHGRRAIILAFKDAACELPRRSRHHFERVLPWTR